MLWLNRKILVLTLLAGTIPSAAVAQGADSELFEKKIRPLFAEK
ncbi:MAG: hypothetical protein R2748_18590 [Bryobacterales bacterium]